MSTHSSVAKSVREDKEKNPADFCPVRRCLWRTTTRHGYNPCRKHPLDCQERIAKLSAVFAPELPADLEGFVVETANGMDVNMLAERWTVDEVNRTYYRLHNPEMRYCTNWFHSIPEAIFDAHTVLIRAEAEQKRQERLSRPLPTRAELDAFEAKRIERIKSLPLVLNHRNGRPDECDGCYRYVLAGQGWLVRNNRKWAVRCERCTEISRPMAVAS